MDTIRIIQLSSDPRADGTFPIVLELEDRRRRATGVSVFKDQWKKQGKQGVVIKHPQADYLNGLINNAFLELANALKAGGMPAKSVRLRRAIAGVDFFAFGRQIEVEFRKQEQFSQADCYRAALNSLENFAGPLTFSQITMRLIIDYRAHLAIPRFTTRAKKLKAASKNTIRNYTGILMAIFKKAEDRRLVKRDDNPFAGFVLGEPEERVIQRMDDREFQRFKSVELENGSSEWFAWATFMIDFYMQGSRVGDTLRFEKKHIYDGRINYLEGKKGRTRSMIIPDQIISIIDQLMQMPGKYLLPYLNNYVDATPAKLHRRIGDCRGQILKRLQSVGKKAGISKEITPHIARHLFAEEAYKKTKDMRAVQKMLGHGRIHTTEKYVGRLSEEGTDDAVKKIFG